MKAKIFLRSGHKIKATEYLNIHRWIVREYGSAHYCSFCGNTEKRVYHWALIHGCIYEYEKKNFIQLCVPCHHKYDMTTETRKKMSLSRMGKRPANTTPLNQFTLAGEFIKTYPDGCTASRETGISRSAISNNLGGQSKHSGGYVWKYVHENHKTHRHAS